jgi:hypothetical protein
LRLKEEKFKRRKVARQGQRAKSGPKQRIISYGFKAKHFDASRLRPGWVIFGILDTGKAICFFSKIK